MCLNFSGFNDLIDHLPGLFILKDKIRYDERWLMCIKIKLFKYFLKNVNLV